MHAVVNHLTFKEPVPGDLFARGEAELGPAMRAIDGFGGFQVAQVSDTEVVLLIFGADEGVVDRIATEVGSPWMREHIVPLLAAPPDRKVGPVITAVDAALR